MAPRILFRALIFFVSLAFLTTGCRNKVDELFKDPDTNPVRKVLKLTMPVAYAVNLTMAAMTGQKLPNVHFVKGSDSSVTPFLLSITVNNTFPLPEGIEADGQILVGGLALDQRGLLITIVFTDLNVKKGLFAVNDVSTIMASQEEDFHTKNKVIFFVFMDADINAHSDTLLTIEMSKGQIEAEIKRYNDLKSYNGTEKFGKNGWIIQVYDKETPADPSDDIYMLNGYGQYTETGSSLLDIMEVLVVNSKMETTCKANPVGGHFVLQSFKAEDHSIELGQIMIAAHTACDGTMDVKAATGVYSRSWGKPIRLNLDQ